MSSQHEPRMASLDIDAVMFSLCFLCCMNWAPWHLQQTVLLDILFKMNAKKSCSCDIVLNNVHDNTFLLHEFDCLSQLPPR